MKAVDATRGELTREFRACWLAVLDTTRPPVRQAVRDLVLRDAAHFADVFYARMRELPRAAPFLAHDVVNRRLRAAMRQWLTQTLSGSTDEDAIAVIIARQIELGTIHARIRMPIDLMTRGTQIILDECNDRLAAGTAGVEARFEAHRYVLGLFSLCDELVTFSYVGEIQRATRVDEAYHLLAQRREAILERERQRALLSEWTQATLFAIGTSTRRGTVPSLAASDFGLWMTHKAKFFFGDDPDLGHVRELMTHIDDALLPQLRARTVQAETRDKLMESLAGKLDLIRYVMADLFQRIERAEQSVDTVTRLPNRRYLPAVLAREIDEHAPAGKRFCAILLRPPRPADVGVAETSAYRDQYLQQFAATLLACIRPGDHLFRYHEDQFMVLAVERTRDQAEALALAIQIAVRDNPLLSRPDALGFGVATGIAEFDGHPDLDDLLRRAERALVEALAAQEPDAIAHR